MYNDDGSYDVEANKPLSDEEKRVGKANTNPTESMFYEAHATEKNRVQDQASH